MNLTLSKNKCKNLIVTLLTLNKPRKCWLFCWLWTKQLVRPPLVSTCMTYGRPCHAIGHQLLPSQPCYCKYYRFERAFFLSGIFYLTLLPAFFKASLGADSSTSRLAGLHADLWNIVLAQLFVWITAIHKSFIWVGSI